MPFCSQCGNQVSAADAYCARCGASQPRASAAPPPLNSMNPQTASILCYIPWVGWIAGIVVLASDRFREDRNVRFHAFQGLYLFVAWLIADQVLRPMSYWVPRLHVYGLVEVVLLGMSIFMMIKAAHQEPYELPLFGELAQRSLAGH